MRRLHRIAIGAIAATVATIVGAAARAEAEDARGLCREAARYATAAYGLPEGLLLAIGTVESGRRDPATGQLHPWPWSADIGGDAVIFPTEAAAIAWVKDAQAHGVVSIDVGCFQVNLLYHPRAFANTEEAFDPMKNANYAAQLLVRLHALTNDWQKAIGLYHSRTPALAADYQRRVANVSRAVDPKLERLEQLQLAWQATYRTVPQTEPWNHTATALGELRLAWDATLDNRQRPTPMELHQVASTPAPVRTSSRWRKLFRSRTLMAGLASPKGLGTGAK